MPSTTRPSPSLERDRPKPPHALKPPGDERTETAGLRAEGLTRELCEQVLNGEAPDADSGRGPETKTRRRWIGVGIAATIAVIAAVGYYFYSRGYESTDDAFIDGHIVQVSPRVPGHVKTVFVTDNQSVSAGDLLVELDPADYEARLAAAQASLAAAEASHESRVLSAKVAAIVFPANEQEASAAVDGAQAKVETARAALATAQAATKQARADLAAAEARQQRAAAYLERIGALVPEHAAAKDTLDEATSADRVASADVAAKREAIHAKEAAARQAEADIAAQLAALERAKAELNAAKSAPQQVAQTRSQSDAAEADLQRAQAEVEQAKLNLSYTKVHAPFAGHVARKNVEIGAYVQSGQPLLAIVEKNVWVTANFKETQLDRMHSGERVSVTVDAYPGVVFAAHVDSIQRGSGAWFSLLPPENATGNFVKVVQRVPVKISFDDPAKVEQYALGPGMSVVPTVRLTAPESNNATAAR